MTGMYLGPDSESIAVMIKPKPLEWARYVVADDREFVERDVYWARDGEPIAIGLDGIPGDPVPVTYDSTTARTAAAHLLGYAHQFDLDEPMPEHILTTLLEPDKRPTTGTTWNLGNGLALRYTAPFGASLTTKITEWTLTVGLATRWARALLTLAAELDHAHAIAAQAVLAERTTRTPTENIRAWLDGIAADLTVEQSEFVDRLRDVLADEESIARDEALFAALDVAHPDLPTSLADLRLLSRETVTHLDAAEVIEQLADRYALPIYLWTAASRYLRGEIGGGMLTEQEWLRVGRTVAMRAFGSFVENEQDNGPAVDVRLALYQAGVLCRECDARITGESVTTLGRCDKCRPTDSNDALREALAAGCPGAPNAENYTSHFLSSSGLCAHCGLPLPEDYHLVLEAEKAEYQQRETARRAIEDKEHRVREMARRLLTESMARGDHDDPADVKERRLVTAREQVRQLRDKELDDHYTSFVTEAKRIIEKGDQSAERDLCM